MNSSTYQIRLAKYAAKKGCKPNQLSNLELTFIAASCRTGKELIQDAAKATISMAKTVILTVPSFVYKARHSICSKCPFSDTSKSGDLFCKKCGCAGASMDAKLHDASQECVLPEPQKRFRKYVNISINGLPKQ